MASTSLPGLTNSPPDHSNDLVHMGDLAVNLAVFLIAGLLFTLGLFFIQQVRNAIRDRMRELDEDEDARMINRHLFETTMVVTSSMRQVQGYMGDYAKHLVKATVALTGVFGAALTLALGVGLDGSTFISRHWAFALLSLVAFVVGAGFSCAGNLTMFRLASSSSALCALACTQGASEGDASQGFNAAFKRIFSAATAIAISSISLAALAVMVSFRAALSRFSVDLQRTHEVSGIIAALAFGMSVVSVMQGLQGCMIARGIDLVFDRFEVDLMRRCSGALECVGSIVGDMVGNNMLFFPVVAEATVMYLLVITVLVTDSSAQAFALMPVVLLTFVMVATALVCVLAMVCVRVDSGRTIVRCTRLIMFGSLALGVVAAFVTALYCLPEQINERGSVGSGQHVASLTRNAAFGLMVMGGCATVLVTEMCELLSTVQFVLARRIASYCDFAAPTTLMASLANSTLTVFLIGVVVVAVIHAAFSVGGFFGLAMVALGALLPMGAMFVVSYFSHLGNNTRTMAEMSHMSHEVCEVADRVAERGNIVGAMAAGYSVVANFMVAFVMVAALMLYVMQVTLSFFSTHVFAFVLLGCVASYGLTSPTLMGAAQAAAALSPTIEAHVQREVQRMHTHVAGDAPADPECVQRVAMVCMRYTLASLALVVLLPAVVGFVFGVDAATGLFFGSALTSFGISLHAVAIGSSTQAVKQFVLKGGLCDASRFAQHHNAAVVTAAMGVPMRSINGAVLVALVKLMGVVCIVLAPVFEMHAVSRN